MNDKGHFYISLVKSLIRFWGCVFAVIFSSIVILAVSLALAEMFGILEEIFDKR